MTKESFEHISSLMDGEFTRDTGLFLIRRLASDELLSAAWERYHLIRDCIRQPGGKQVVTGLSEKLNASLVAEAVPSNAFRNYSRWLKPVSGLAIATSVALVAIMVTAPQPGTLPSSAVDTALVTPVNKPFVSPNTLPMAPVSQAVSYAGGQTANSRRLNAYLLRHNQIARTAGRQGFIAFVPILATQSPTRTETPDEVSAEPERLVSDNKRSDKEAVTDK